MTVFRALRTELGMSQSTLSHLLDMDQARVSAMERGVRNIRDIVVVARVASALRIPACTLGFPEATVDGDGDHDTPAHPELEADMLRRDFVNHATLISLGTVAGLDTDWLKALTTEDAPDVRHVGAADAERIEHSTETWMAEDYARGSGAARDAALAQLQAVLPLLDAEAPTPVRPKLTTAIAELASMTAYMSYDVGKHDAARRLWLAALRLAREADAQDLMVHIHYDLAMQAVHLQQPGTALKHTKIGHAIATSGNVSPATMCCLWAIQARAHAAQDDATNCYRALTQTTEAASNVQPGTRPRWTPALAERDASMNGHQGQTLYLLASTRRDGGIAEAAVAKLRPGTVYTDGYGKLKAMRLPDLAGAYLLAGDLDTALTVGHHAADAATEVSSDMVTTRLRTLDTVLSTIPPTPAITELRHRLSSTAA